MKSEKLILSLTAIVIGIVVAGAGFYGYQRSNIQAPSILKLPNLKNDSSTPTDSPKVDFTISAPSDETVSDQQLIKFVGKSNPQNVIVVSTDSSDKVLFPDSKGEFAVDISLDEGTNSVEVYSIAPNGQSIKIVRTITYSTETF